MGLTYSGDGANGFVTGDHFTAANANEIKAAIDAITSGPLLGSSDSGDGLFENLPLAQVDQARTNYKVWVENFDQTIDSATDFAQLGCTVTEVGAVDTPHIRINASHQRVSVNPGLAASTGYNIQFNVPASQATYINNRIRVPQAFGVISTSMGAGRELIWYARVGFASNAATWDGAALLGWFTDDISLLNPTTGVPSVATNGGLGFHIGQDGIVTFVCDDAAITAVGTPVGSIVGQLSGTSLDANFWEVGFRMTVTDFTAHSGTVKVYFGPSGSMVEVLDTTQTGTLPLVDGQTYSISWSILNGPVQQSDLYIESMLTAISRTNN